MLKLLNTTYNELLTQLENINGNYPILSKLFK